MKLKSSIQECLAHALRSCPALCTKLGPQGLACLATSSKCCRDVANEAVSKEQRDLLAYALDTARSTGLGVHFKAVAWLAVQLLRQEPETAVGITEQLLTLPNVPLSMAKQVVSAGMRVTYAQLLAAASSLVEGVEVWVQAQQLLPITHDIPDIAVAICCRRDWVSGAKFLRDTLSCTTATQAMLPCSCDMLLSCCVPLLLLPSRMCLRDARDSLLRKVQPCCSWPSTAPGNSTSHCMVHWTQSYAACHTQLQQQHAACQSCCSQLLPASCC
jgi:hypothetical protein